MHKMRAAENGFPNPLEYYNFAKINLPPDEMLKPIFEEGGIAGIQDFEEYKLKYEASADYGRAIDDNLSVFVHPVHKRAYKSMREFSDCCMEREVEDPAERGKKQKLAGCNRGVQERLGARYTPVLRVEVPEGDGRSARASDLMPNFGCEYQGHEGTCKKNSVNLWTKNNF